MFHCRYYQTFMDYESPMELNLAAALLCATSSLQADKYCMAVDIISNDCPELVFRIMREEDYEEEG